LYDSTPKRERRIAVKRIVVSSLLGVFLVLVPLTLRAAEATKSEVDGTWEMIRLSDNGKDDQETVKAKFVVVRENGTQTITKEGKVWKKLRYTLNPKSKPKQITWSDPAQGDKVTAVGIYEVDGDTMKVAVFSDEAKRVAERPKDFKPSEDKKVAFYRWVKGK
jgi:uncharacterized protein (TIGR03067 family)